MTNLHKEALEDQPANRGTTQAMREGTLTGGRLPIVNTISAGNGDVTLADTSVANIAELARGTLGAHNTGHRLGTRYIQEL